MGVTMTMHEAPRRPIKVRQSRWAAALARLLLRMGMRPNQVSVLSMVFAGLAGGCILLSGRVSPVWGIFLLVMAAAFIQLRLLCNLLDGMLAVEGGLKTPAGELFNDLPDRISDCVVLLVMGYAVTWVSWGDEMGWAAALLAIATAYVRVLGGSAGARQHFTGPMAKQQRMALVTVACLFSAVETAIGWPTYAFTIALAVIILGCVPTIVIRLKNTYQDLMRLGDREGMPR